MAFLKIVAVALLSTLSCTQSSLIAPAIPAAVPALRYTHVAPPSVLPFSAQVSTFTRNLHVFDAPYAAGVLPGPPAIVQRALPVAAPFVPRAAVLPAPFVPRAAPLPLAGYPYPAGLIAPWARSVHAVAPAPLLG